MESKVEKNRGTLLSILKSIASSKGCTRSKKATNAPPKAQQQEVIVVAPANGKALRRKRKRTMRKERKRMERVMNDEKEENFNKCGYKSEIEVMKPFYHSYREKWPENDVLSNVTNIESSARSLLNEIKKMDVGVHLSHSHDSKFPMLRNILKRILKRHIHAPYKYMAWHYASLGMAVEMKVFKKIQTNLSEWSGTPSDSAGEKPCESLLQFADYTGEVESAKSDHHRNNFDVAVPSDKVIQFLSSCVRHSIPLEFFGSKHNRRYFIKKWIHVLVGIPGKKSVGLGYLMHRIKVSQIKWSEDASPVGGRGQRACFVAKAWLWLLLKYLGVILSCHFIMVNTSGEGHGGRQRVFFARRVWNYLKMSTIEDHLEVAGNISEKVKENTGWAITSISSEEKDKILKGNGSPLPACLQLKPKKSSMRPVLAVKVLRKDELKLKACVELLEYLATNCRGRSPSHNTMDDVSKAWAAMFEKRMASGKSLNDEPQFYGVTVDVKDAFGCVLQDKLCEILEKKLEKAKLSSHTVLMLKVAKYLTQPKEGKKYYKTRYELLGLPAKEMVSENAKGKEVSVLRREPFQILEMYEFMIKCIKFQIVKDGKKFYLLSRGIAQGNPLSYFLWKIYCDSMEDKHLIPHLSVVKNAAKFSYLIRGADDYLFLSEDLEEAKWFLQRMTEGFPDYNIQVRTQKNYTTLNREETLNMGQVKVKNAPDLKFWGLILNPVNFSVMADYGGPPARDLRDAFYLYVLKKPKRILESRTNLERLKLSPILLNINYSGYRGVAINFYRAALMQGSYFHAAAKIVLTFQNQVLLIEVLSRKVCSLVSRIISIVEMNHINKPLERTELFWLAYNAYRKVLSCHGGRYPGVIKAIKWLIKYYSRKVDITNLQILKEVVDSCNLSNDLTL